MRSFAVIAGFAAAANAYAVAYPEAYNTTTAAYEAATSAAEYPAYPVETSSAAEYPAYPAETSSAAEYSAYPVESSMAPEYPAYTTTAVVSSTSFVCPEATTVTYAESTYVVSSSTVLTIPEYTTTYEVKPTPSAEVSTYTPPAYTAAPPAPAYPSSNGTVPAPPAGTGYSTGAMPSATSPPEFTGAAGKATIGFMAIVGAVAAFL